MTREIEARLRISALDKTGNVFRSVAGKMDQINRRADALNRRQSLFARNAADSFALLSRYAAPMAAAYAAKAALTDFAAVERQMTRIGITANASGKEVEGAFVNLQTMSKDMAMPVDQAVTALDTLVSSGMSLKEAMGFLPSVLATAQASGSATEDIANTAIKAASALGLQAKEMQKAFDIMVAGGKEGQFELKDMAAYIPELANSFASLGYKGEDGLKQLIALLQTLREDTGTAEAAATQAQNIFGKMYSSDTSAKFKKFGIDLRAELEAAAKNGEDAVSAFVRLSKEAIKGDLSKLPLLFTDQEFRLGMQSLITSADSYKKFVDAVNNGKVDGTVLRDLGTVLHDTQSSIDRMSSSWDRLVTNFGKTIAPGAVAVMDSISNATDRNDAVRRGLQKRGMGFMEGEWHRFTNPGDENQLAYEGGYRADDFMKEYWAERYKNGQVKSSTGRQGVAVPRQDFPGGGSGSGVTIPGRRPVSSRRFPGKDDDDRAMSRPQYHDISLRPDQRNGDFDHLFDGTGKDRREGRSGNGFFRIPSSDELKGALSIEAGISGLKQSGEEAGQKVAEGGTSAKDSIGEGAALIKIAGVDAGAAISQAAQSLVAAAAQIAAAAGSIRGAANAGAVIGGGARRGGVNANLGVSTPRTWDGEKV